MTQEEMLPDMTVPLTYFAIVMVLWFLFWLRLQLKIKKSGLTKTKYMKKYPRKKFHHSYHHEGE